MPLKIMKPSAEMSLCTYLQMRPPALTSTKPVARNKTHLKSTQMGKMYHWYKYQQREFLVLKSAISVNVHNPLSLVIIYTALIQKLRLLATLSQIMPAPPTIRVQAKENTPKNINTKPVKRRADRNAMLILSGSILKKAQFQNPRGYVDAFR